MHSLSNNRNSKNLNSPLDEPSIDLISSNGVVASNNNNLESLINNSSLTNNCENSLLNNNGRRILPPVPHNVHKQSSPPQRQLPPPPPKRTNSLNSTPSTNNTTDTHSSSNNSESINNPTHSPPHHYHHHRTLPTIPVRNYEIDEMTSSPTNNSATTSSTFSTKKDPMQASTWIKGLQMVSDDSRGLLSASTLAKTINVNNQSTKPEEEKRTSFGRKTSEQSSENTRHLPPPLKINRMESPNNDVNNELAKQLQKLKKTPATPTTNSTSSNGSSNPSSRHSSIELQRGGEPETSAEKKLFEVVVVVKLKKTDKLEPFIDYEFPPQNVRSTKDLKLVMSVPLFCFPDIDTVKEESSLSGGDKKTYSFVLTEIDGTRKYGYCRRMLPKGSGKRLPETYCIISSHSCFGLFSTILDNIETRNEINNVACFTFLKSVLANPFPSPGTCTIVKTVNPKTGQQEEVKLSRPILADPMLEYINFNILFESLSAENIITMFAFLLMERRMVIFSNDISKLSAFCQAMISILYPFTWQHVFIPVLPQSLVDYVCSPVPFVIGVLSNHKPYIEELKKDGQVETEVLYIDIDSGKVTEPATLKDQKKILPSNKDLTKKLAAIAKEIKNSKNSNQVAMAKDTFLMFFVKLFGDYKAFIKPNAEASSSEKKKNTPDWIFDTKIFLDFKKKNHKKKYEKFFINFTQCQMFERWSAEIANQSQNKSVASLDKELGLFEQLSAISQQQILLDKKK